MRLLLLLVALLTTNSLFSQNIFWDGGAGTNDWDDAMNWDTNQLPTSTSNVYITTGDSVSISNGVVTAKQIQLSLNSVLEISENSFVFLNSSIPYDRLNILSGSKCINHGLISISGGNRGIRMSSASSYTDQVLVNYGDIIALSGGHSLSFNDSHVTNYGLINFDRTISTNNSVVENYGDIVSTGNNHLNLDVYIGHSGSSIYKDNPNHLSYSMYVDSLYGNPVIGSADQLMGLAVDYVSPGFSPGILHTTNLDYAEISEIDIEIGADTMDHIFIDGDLVLFNSELNIELIDGYIPSITDTLNFIIAGGNIAGTFTTINLPPEMSDFIVDYSNPSAIRLIYNPALPVELISFDGVNERGQNILHWKTATEINNAGFNIEVLNSNSVDWQTLGFVEGNTNSTAEIEYSFIDKFPVKGISYYRLKQMDLNGGWEYSDQISIRNNKSTVRVYPTVFTDDITVDIDSKTSMELVDQEGRMVYSKQLAEGKQSISLNHMVSGIYFVKIDNEVFKVIKR